MINGKPLFAGPPDSDGEETGDYSSVPDEATYRVDPTPVRRQLTPRDLEYNGKVKTLFDNIVPGLPIDTDPPETRRDAEPFSAIIEKTLKRLNIAASPWLDELVRYRRKDILDRLQHSFGRDLISKLSFRLG